MTLQPDDLGGEGVEEVGAELLSVPPPAFPEAAQGTGAYARVLVAVRVDDRGAVIETRIKSANLEGGGDAATLSAAFREAAQQAARKARFEPAQRNGKPVASWGELTFEFGKRPGG